MGTSKWTYSFSRNLYSFDYFGCSEIFKSICSECVSWNDCINLRNNYLGSIFRTSPPKYEATYKKPSVSIAIPSGTIASSPKLSKWCTIRPFPIWNFRNYSFQLSRREIKSVSNYQYCPFLDYNQTLEWLHYKNQHDRIGFRLYSNPFHPKVLNLSRDVLDHFWSIVTV